MTKLEAWKAWCESAGTPDLATEFTLEQSSHGKAFSFAWERGWEVDVWGECEPQEALEDGWCDWVCPKPQGYLMQCCDCELIHEVDFRVVQYEPRPSEVYEVVDDPNLQAQMRLRRRDDLSPKREWVGLTDEELEEMHNEIKVRLMGTYRTEDIYRSIEAKLKEKNHG